MERVLTNVEVVETIGQLFEKADVNCLYEVVGDIEASKFSQASNVSRDFLILNTRPTTITTIARTVSSELYTRFLVFSLFFVSVPCAR